MVFFFFLSSFFIFLLYLGIILSFPYNLLAAEADAGVGHHVVYQLSVAIASLIAAICVRKLLKK